MERKIDPDKLLQLHETIANKHKGINGFYRFNLKEIEGQFRKGVKTPALLLLSHSSALNTNANKTANFNTHFVSLLIIDFAGKPNDFTKENIVLNETYYLALDVVSYLKKEHANENSFLYSLFDVTSVSIEKVGPIFDNMFGWNLIFSLKNQEPFCFEPDKWED